MKKTLTAIAGLCLAAILNTGCGKESTKPSDHSAAPNLPPSLSMKIDLSAFVQGRAALEARENSAAPETVFNWTNAIVRVLIVNAFVDAALTPPFIAFSAALTVDPVREESGTWLWSYSVQEGDEEWRLDLRGRPESGHVAWSMRVTGTDGETPLDNVLWFHGETNEAGASGHWVFHDPADAGSRDIARVDWSVLSDTDVSLTLKDIDPTSPDRGDNLGYRVLGTTASVTYEDVGSGDGFDVKWDTETNAGSILAADYNDGALACWDTNGQDVDCSAARR